MDSNRKSDLLNLIDYIKGFGDKIIDFKQVFKAMIIKFDLLYPIDAFLKPNYRLFSSLVNYGPKFNYWFFINYFQRYF